MFFCLNLAVFNFPRECRIQSFTVGLTSALLMSQANHSCCPPPRCGRKAPSQSEVGRKVTTRSITPTTAAATTKTPFIDPKESVTNGILVNATAPSTKSPGLLQGMFQNLLGAFQLSSILLTFLVSFQIKNINTNF